MYRFTLANERTFLAWMRTTLAVLAGGLVLDQFSTRWPPALVGSVALLLCALSAVLAVQAYAHWRANEIVMRHRRGLPSVALLPLLASCISLTAGLLADILLFALT